MNQKLTVKLHRAQIDVESKSRASVDRMQNKKRKTDNDGAESDEAQEVELRRHGSTGKKKYENGDGKQDFVSRSAFKDQQVLDEKDYETDQGIDEQPNVNPQLIEKQNSGAAPKPPTSKKTHED